MERLERSSWISIDGNEGEGISIPTILSIQVLGPISREVTLLVTSLFHHRYENNQAVGLTSSKFFFFFIKYPRTSTHLSFSLFIFMVSANNNVKIIFPSPDR